MNPLNRIDSGSSRYVEDFSFPEYVAPLEKFIWLWDYFSTTPEKTFESIDLNLDGREIKVMGITEEESADELQKAFGDLINPVVCIGELSKVIDSFLRNELLREFDILSYRTQRGTMEWNEPIITPQAIEQEQTARKTRRLQKRLMSLFQPVVKPLVLKQELEALPPDYKEHFQRVLKLVQKRIDVFDTLTDSYVDMHTLKFVLGEELSIRLAKTLPVLWRLPKENVLKFQQLIEYHLMGVQGTEAATGPSDGVVLLSKDDTVNADQLLKEFLQVKDYILNEKSFPKILPFTNMSLHPWPRIERIKQALRNYFLIEEMWRFVNREMILYYEHITKLDSDLRDQLEEMLEKEKTTEAKLEALAKFPLPPFKFSKKEIDVFVLFLTTFVSRANQLLLGDPFEPVEEQISFEESVRDDLAVIEETARLGLDSTIREIEVLVSFTRGGRKITVGKPKPNRIDMDVYLSYFQEEEIPESYPDKIIFVETPDVDDDWETLKSC